MRSVHLRPQGLEFNSETQSHVTLVSPLRGNTFPLVQNETFMCEQRQQREKKKNVQLPQRHAGFIWCHTTIQSLPPPPDRFHYSWEEQGLVWVMMWSFLFLSFNQITEFSVFFLLLVYPVLSGSELELLRMAARFSAPVRRPHRSGCYREARQWQGQMAANTHTHTHIFCSWGQC